MSEPAKQVKSKSHNPTGKGGFKKGQSGNPKGRPKKGFAISDRIRKAVSDEDWEAIILKATEQAKEGDKSARDFLVDRTDGKPTQPTADVSEGWKEWLDGVFEDTEQE